MADTPEDSQICRLVIERNLVTQEELREASERQQQTAANGHQRPIGEVMVSICFVALFATLPTQY